MQDPATLISLLQHVPANQTGCPERCYATPSTPWQQHFLTSQQSAATRWRQDADSW